MIAAKLIEHGRSKETPAAVIRQGTTAEQETVIGTLADIADKSASLKAPALIVVGEVVQLAGKLDWFLSNTAQDHEDFPSQEQELSLGL
jgi:siroheme synthase